MSGRHNVAVSRAATDAMKVLGQQIRQARTARRWTLKETADRLGIDRRTVSSIESGSPRVTIGAVFTTAALVGVDLFGLSGAELARARRLGEETLALLPERVRKTVAQDDDDDLDF